MFKKLKDKIAEEVKQSPLKFQASVQQLAQAVSPSSSTNNSSLDTSVTELPDDEEDEEKEKREATDDITSASEYDSSFTTVDLRSPITPKTRRLSSSSSVTSELFPIYEFPTNRYAIQSDLESCSEFDDGSSIHQFGNVTKENLYEKYRNILQKYHKYRGRFTDMRKYCQELQREHSKAKSILTETQDKAIRRIAELKEQCSLEQKAKAHLEDALRNELEEREHIINTLNTKIELLKSGKNEDDERVSKFVSSNELRPIVKENISASENSDSKIINLKEKIKNFESLLSKAKDVITSKNTQVQELRSKAEADMVELKSLQSRIKELESSIDLMKRKEEDALLSVAENKLHVHQELEAKEAHIKTLENKISEFKEEIKKFKNSAGKTVQEMESLQTELQQLKTSRLNDQAVLASKERLLNEFKKTVDSSNTELLKLRNEIRAANLVSRGEDVKIADLKSELKENRTNLKNVDTSMITLVEKQKNFESTISQLNQNKKRLEDRVSLLEQELATAKSAMLEKNSLCESLNDQLISVQDVLKKTKKELEDKKTLSNNVQQVELELADAKVKLEYLTKERKLWVETETYLKADKIVLDETLKSIRHELSKTQTELLDAKNTIAKYEKDADDMKNMESRLQSSENELSQLKAELEDRKKTEHETNALIEEVNSCRENYLVEIKSLKTQLDARKDSEILREEDHAKKRQLLTDQLNEVSSELKEKVEALQQSFNENVTLKNEIEKLTVISADMDTLKLQHQLLQNEQKSQLEELRKLIQENESIRCENISLKNEHQIWEENSKQLASDLMNLQGEVDDLRKENKDLLSEISVAEKYVDSGEKLKAETECEIEGYRSAINKLQIDCESYSVAYGNVVLFLDELRCVLEQCLHYKHIVASLQKAQQKVILEKEEKTDQISSLKNEISELVSEKNSLNSEILSLKTSLENTNISNTQLDEKLIFSVRNQTTDLKEKYVEFKTEVGHDLNLLKQYWEDSKLKVNNGPLRTVKNYTENYSKLENNLSNMKQEYCYLKNKTDILESEKRRLEDRIQELDHLLASAEACNTANEIVIGRMKNEYSSEVKQIVSDFENQLTEKEKEYEELQNKFFASSEAQEAVLNRETNEMIQNLEEELGLKHDAYEKLLEKYKEDTEKLRAEKLEMKDTYAKDLRKSDKKWRCCLDKKIQEVEEKYKEEINELTREWSNDRKQISSILPVENEATAQVLESYATQSESSEMLKSQIQIMSSEMNNCKRNEHHSDSSLEDFTEMEYLRNVLFEYMMGHQPLVLAKVLSAVVKFDNDQTRQVIQREEQKLSVLGQLGLS